MAAKESLKKWKNLLAYNWTKKNEWESWDTNWKYHSKHCAFKSSNSAKKKNGSIRKLVEMQKLSVQLDKRKWMRKLRQKLKVPFQMLHAIYYGCYSQTQCIQIIKFSKQKKNGSKRKLEEMQKLISIQLDKKKWMRKLRQKLKVPFQMLSDALWLLLSNPMHSNHQIKQKKKKAAKESLKKCKNLLAYNWTKKN